MLPQLSQEFSLQFFQPSLVFSAQLRVSSPMQVVT